MRPLIKNQSKTKKRTKTKNQKRIEQLMSLNNGSVEGLPKVSLLWPNCPNEIYVHKNYLSKYHLTYKELFYFMIKKFNLTPPLNKTKGSDQQKYEKVNPKDTQWYRFVFHKSWEIDQKDLDYAFSKLFTKEYMKIGKKFKLASKEHPNYFKGIKDQIFFEQDYQLPCEVLISKDTLVELFTPQFKKNIQNESNESTNGKKKRKPNPKIKKLHRGMSFFFEARFNLKNATRMDRDVLRYARNKVSLQNCKENKQTNYQSNKFDRNDEPTRKRIRRKRKKKQKQKQKHKSIKLLQLKTINQKNENLQVEMPLEKQAIKTKKRTKNKPKKRKLLIKNESKKKQNLESESEDIKELVDALVQFWKMNSELI
ncbi:hypothetical protein M0812_05172 [Anaeramoeba flamelloides]|uniref:Uncharacterized protein n=1 Tax=Anaeramoeba flamelloides TaxID=1746091 RepID=A0AAV8ACG3_9EUKA|nr:hypothetical protein M0812_05172 [Anaeramoeba flamelloides]